ncbi:g12388 [Coccomyxa viridis]|uniref:G12388 protein n=1 Tax=Coccomyxa viridis TaxID=1274662 RepID=A0ABP1GH85_9CHLO
MALRINASDVASLFDTISNSSSVPDVISATVFRAGYRSEAVYVRSEDSSVSNGAGYVQTLAIAATFVPEADCGTDDFSLALYMGFVGDDRNSNAFQTGYQISQVNQYAVSTLYNNIVQQVTDVLNSAQTGYVGGGTSSAAAGGDGYAA